MLPDILHSMHGYLDVCMPCMCECQYLVLWYRHEWLAVNGTHHFVCEEELGNK